jgi:hypothetical protein
MAMQIYQCPISGLRVQGWFADDAPTIAGEESYHPAFCYACRGTHLVNPITGKVLDAGLFRTCVRNDIDPISNVPYTIVVQVRIVAPVG